MRNLNEAFYARDSRKVGFDLIGKVLTRHLKGKIVSGIISQTDAYSMRHATPNQRNAGAFYAPGAIHMYPTQGKYMLAISTLEKGKYNEVLIRKIVPFEGVDIMRKHRRCDNEKDLTNGPGKIVEALALDKEFDGSFIYDQDSGLWVTELPISKDARVRKDKEVNNGDESEDFVGRYTLIA